jgi:hypothetical protein
VLRPAAASKNEWLSTHDAPSCLADTPVPRKERAMDPFIPYVAAELRSIELHKEAERSRLIAECRRPPAREAVTGVTAHWRKWRLMLRRSARPAS